MTNPRSDIDLFTVSSADFLPGTQTMLDSFLRHNSWFGGAITIVHDDLTEKMQHELIARFPGLHCTAPADELRARIDALVAIYPTLLGKARRFYSLQAFAGDPKRLALFVDSDVLFCGSIEALARMTGPLTACGDRAQLVGHVRDPASLAEIEHPGETTRFRSFNAGVMAISAELRTARIFQDLLGDLDSSSWSAVATEHTDQAVLNRRFGHRVALVEQRFNRMLGHGTRLPAAHTCPVESALVLHFNGRAKPWRMDEAVRSRLEDPDFAYGLKAWHRAYRSYLAGRDASHGLDA